MGFPGGNSGKEPVGQCRRYKRHGFDPWVGKSPWRRAWQPTPVFMPRESRGQRSLVGYSPWGCKESDRTEPTLACTHIQYLSFSVWLISLSIMSQNPCCCKWQNFILFYHSCNYNFFYVVRTFKIYFLAIFKYIIQYC